MVHLFHKKLERWSIYLMKKKNEIDTTFSFSINEINLGEVAASFKSKVAAQLFPFSGLTLL